MNNLLKELNLDKHIKEIRLSNTKSKYFDSKYNKYYTISYKYVINRKDYLKFTLNLNKKTNLLEIKHNNFYDLSKKNYDMYYIYIYIKLDNEIEEQIKYYKRLLKFINELTYINENFNYKIIDYHINQEYIKYNHKMIKYLNKKILNINNNEDE